SSRLRPCRLSSGTSCEFRSRWFPTVARDSWNGDADTTEPGKGKVSLWISACGSAPAAAVVTSVASGAFLRFDAVARPSVKLTCCARAMDTGKQIAQGKRSSKISSGRTITRLKLPVAARQGRNPRPALIYITGFRRTGLRNYWKDQRTVFDVLTSRSSDG